MTPNQLFQAALQLEGSPWRVVRTDFSGQPPATQGAIEAINGIIQLAKRRARGFRNFLYLPTIAYWVAGQLKANLPSYLPT